MTFRGETSFGSAPAAEVRQGFGRLFGPLHPILAVT